MQKENNGSSEFQVRRRVSSMRLKNWDYSSPGFYFITICTKNREHFFGKIVGTKGAAHQTMQLSEIGRIVAEEWENTKYIRKNVIIDEWIVMPDHFHGIVMINETENGFEDDNNGMVDTKCGLVGAHCHARLLKNTQNFVV